MGPVAAADGATWAIAGKMTEESDKREKSKASFFILSSIDSVTFWTGAAVAKLPPTIYTRRVELLVEKLMAVFFLGKRAAVILSESAIAIARDRVVSPVAKRPRHQSQESFQRRPDAANFLQDDKPSVGARYQPLVRLSVVKHDVDGIQILRGNAVMPQKVDSKIALQGCKAKAVARIALEDETYEAIAKRADAVIKDDRVGTLQIHRAEEKTTKTNR